MKKFLWAIALAPFLVLPIGCEKDAPSASVEQLAGTQEHRMAGSEKAAAQTLVAIGTPTSVTATWTRSGPANCRYCNLKLTTTSIVGATTYQWKIMMYGTEWLTKTTTANVWNVGLWAEGQTCFTVKVRVLNSSGFASKWYTSPLKCPPSSPPCCAPEPKN